MSCAYGKVRVETCRPVGCELYKTPGYRMMQADTAEREGLSGEPMECPLCPYLTWCPRAER